MVRRHGLLACCFMVLVLGGSVLGAQPAQTDQFVPVGQVPAAEQLPAAPLVIAAYAFVWVAVFVYLWSIWRRIGKVEADMRALDRRSVQRSGAR